MSYCRAPAAQHRRTSTSTSFTRPTRFTSNAAIAASERRNSLTKPRKSMRCSEAASRRCGTAVRIFCRSRRATRAGSAARRRRKASSSNPFPAGAGNHRNSAAAAFTASTAAQPPPPGGGEGVEKPPLFFITKHGRDSEHMFYNKPKSPALAGLLGRTGSRVPAGGVKSICGWLWRRPTCTAVSGRAVDLYERAAQHARPRQSRLNGPESRLESRKGNHKAKQLGGAAGRKRRRPRLRMAAGDAA